jgi:peptide/nickel transport system ATP-binding protein
VSATALRPMETGPLLEVRDLRTTFETSRGLLRAVDGVSLDLERGRTLGIVGESGSGKSMLVRSIMRILPSTATVRGEVRFEGRDVDALTGPEARHFWGVEMAMVFQDPMTSLNPTKKVGEHIAESLRHHRGMSRRAAKTRTIDLLAHVGLPAPRERVDDYPHQLSGGMRQRVTIAMALACEPKLLFADEPTTALDVTVQKQILDLLGSLQRELDMAMILITHDLGVVAGRAKRINVMYGGQIVETATTRTLFRQMRHPYTEALLNSIPRIEHPSHHRLEAIAGRPPDMTRPPSGCRFAPRCRLAQPSCVDEPPQLVAGADATHYYRCFFPVGTAAGEEAASINLANGKTGAGLDLRVEAVS